MATSFAAYASQYLNRQDESPPSSSQPMFFSFTTDNGSRAGHDTDLDDLDDPHIRESEVSRSTRRRPEEDDDPYLRLDEDEQTPTTNFHSKHRNAQLQRVPFIQSDNASSVSSSRHGGWLAHLASSPFRHSPSPSPSRSSTSSNSEPPPDLVFPAGSQTRALHPPPPSSRQPVSLSLTESLLPRDGLARPIDVFNLPDPRHTPRNRRRYNDSVWTALWLAGVSICYLFSIILLFLSRKPSKPGVKLPYTTLLHTVPMLTILTILSGIVAYTHIFLLRIFVRPVMIATSVFIPATLFISAVWAFVGSFMWDSDGPEPTWGETVGLRLFSIIPLGLSILTARRLAHLPRDIHVTSSTLTLTTHLLIANPFLLALSPAILLIALIGSIPFLTLIFRLVLYGYTLPVSSHSSTLEGHISGWANWAIAGTVAVWLWSWGVARGILRMSCASVIGAWYFADPDALPQPPMSTHTIHAAAVRSTGSSLGTVCLSALILTIIRLLTLFTLFLERLPAYIPPRAFFLTNGIRAAVGYLDGVTTALSKYALVYTGMTGDPFMPSARRARALTTAIETRVDRGRKKGRSEPPLTLLTVAPLTLSFPFSLLTYIFVAHTIGAPNQALGASVLAGGVTALVGLFCVGLVKDTADTLYMCYCIDKDTGQQRREEVFILFEYENRNRITARGRPNRPRQALSSQPEEIIPLPARSPPSKTAQLPAQPQGQQLPQVSSQSRPSKQIPVSPPPVNPTTVISRSVPLSRAPIAVETDDVDPFKHSFAEEHHEVPPNPSDLSLRSPSPTLSLQLELEPEQQLERHAKMEKSALRTSAELNMKSHVWGRAAALSESSDEDEAVELHKKFMAGRLSKGKAQEEGSGSHRRSDSLKRTGLAGSGSERGQGSSQFFPGSDFF